MIFDPKIVRSFLTIIMQEAGQDIALPKYGLLFLTSLKYILLLPINIV